MKSDKNGGYRTEVQRCIHEIFVVSICKFQLCSSDGHASLVDKAVSKVVCTEWHVKSWHSYLTSQADHIDWTVHYLQQQQQKYRRIRGYFYNKMRYKKSTYYLLYLLTYQLSLATNIILLIIRYSFE